MVTVEEARIKLEGLFHKKSIVKKDLYQANGFILAESIVSEYNIPHFDNSAMDGYAINREGWDGLVGFEIIGESAAGDNITMALPPGKSMRIFTGAMVPQGTDAVVMQEKTKVENGSVFILEENIKPGMNIRLEGSQTEIGDCVLQSGHAITAGSIGFLASIGVKYVLVYEKPTVKIIVTGKEIISPGQPILPGQVFECNSYSLYGALSQLGIHAEIEICGDIEEEITNSISNALNQFNLVIITGGISVGDYDFVLPALQKNGVEELFYKVKQKPAKPLYLGKKNETIVFGLPGNPASVLTSFYVYILPLIQAISGTVNPLKTIKARVTSDIHKKAGMTHFVKGFYADKEVEVLPGQESYRMDAFAFANCLIEIAAESELIKAGSEVDLILF